MELEILIGPVFFSMGKVFKAYVLCFLVKIGVERDLWFFSCYNSQAIETMPWVLSDSTSIVFWVVGW